MRNLKDIIVEKLNISKAKITKHTLFPTSKDELIEMIKSEMENNGNECDLNHIDVSEITDMSFVFSANESNEKFEGDISGWDVSNVTTMAFMFDGSNFNGDISGWDVSKVTNMSNMFEDSYFNGDLSSWDVSNVTDMCGMFYNSSFTGENGDISNWNVAKLKWTDQMFRYTPLNAKPPKWYFES
jgi:surface protein